MTETAAVDHPSPTPPHALVELVDHTLVVTMNRPAARNALSAEGKHENDCWKDDAKVGAAVFASDDSKEGPRAFAEKRAPSFTGS